jgi:GNAT superfamily N-acetyltransferase
MSSASKGQPYFESVKERTMEIRFVAQGEEESCNDLHNRIYRQNRTIRQWTWAFAANNYRTEQIPYVVLVENGAIVGTQAFIPIRMVDEAGVYWTAKSEGTLLDPAYRGRQLFEKMYTILFDYAKEHQFATVWGFTRAVKALTAIGFDVPGKTKQIFLPFSSRSVQVLMSEAWHDPETTATRKLKVSALRISCLLAQSISAMKIVLCRQRVSSGLDLRTWDKPDQQAGDLCSRFVQKWGGTTIYRDAEYLQWRLFDNPYVKSIVRAIYDRDQLLGWTAFTLGDDGMGYLVDLMVACDSIRYGTDDLVRTLLLEAVIGTRNMGAVGIRGWRVNNHPFDKLVCRVARRVGFYHVDRGYSVVLYDCEAGRRRASYQRFDDWHVSRIFTEGVLG